MLGSYRTSLTQYGSKVVLTLYAKDQEQEKVNIKVRDEKILDLKLDGCDMSIELFGKIATGSDVTTKVTSKKVEIILIKSDATLVWDGIQRVEDETKKPSLTTDAYKKDWNSIIDEINKNEKTESNPDDLFKKIFADASDEQRMAMTKSYQTSGGTVLSTNWDEVKDRDYESEMNTRIADGEYKKY